MRLPEIVVALPQQDCVTSILFRPDGRLKYPILSIGSFWKHVVVFGACLLTEARLSEVHQQVVVDMLGADYVSATALFVAVA